VPKIHPDSFTDFWNPEDCPYDFSDLAEKVFTYSTNLGPTVFNPDTQSLYPIATILLNTIIPNADVCIHPTYSPIQKPL